LTEEKRNFPSGWGEGGRRSRGKRERESDTASTDFILFYSRPYCGGVRGIVDLLLIWGKNLGGETDQRLGGFKKEKLS